jgi:hypothetical protein
MVIALSLSFLVGLIGLVMLLESVSIKGFRNYADACIHFTKSTLIVGANNSGKSNLLFALRILFDPTLSVKDFELSDVDFNIEALDDEVEITAKLATVDEPCLLSTFGKYLSDEKEVYITYRARRDGTYSFYAGPDRAEGLKKVTSRFYIQNLMLEYVESARDISAFIKRRQRSLIEHSKDRRSEQECEDDESRMRSIQQKLNELNDEISNLNYVSDSLVSVNEEMEKLSFANSEFEAKFVAGNTDATRLVDNLRLAYLYGESPLTFGGDGRRNQLYFATWISDRIHGQVEQKETVYIFAIEEPEAHLHPHQQRRLASYLSGSIDEQTLISTHSPQIVASARYAEILRMPAVENNAIRASLNPVSVPVDLRRFGYRMDPITSEVFFADAVLLVEGPSERLFYTALANAIELDLDHLNISIIAVNGVGFLRYVEICRKLNVPFAMRTDNDIFHDENNGKSRFAGVLRGVRVAEGLDASGENLNRLKVLEPELSWMSSESNTSSISASEEAVRILESYGVFLASVDLETDLVESSIYDSLRAHYGIEDKKKLISAMQRRKAENMFEFLLSNPDLSVLRTESLSSPLLHLSSQMSDQND